MTSALVAVAPTVRLAGEALNSWGAVSPLMCDSAAPAVRHNSIQTPIHAVRVRTVVGAATGAFAGAGSYAARKQGRPPRGTPR